MTAREVQAEEEITHEVLGKARGLGLLGVIAWNSVHPCTKMRWALPVC